MFKQSRTFSTPGGPRRNFIHGLDRGNVLCLEGVVIECVDLTVYPTDARPVDYAGVGMGGVDYRTID
jgi:hypothetical protein